ncbi:MAG: CoA transferase [Pseudomonadota bacterium]
MTTATPPSPGPSAHALQPLRGVRVIDLSNVVFGPLASQVLADYGADVIKVEPPEGDITRRTGPAAEPGMAAAFLGNNRSKRAIVLDLKQPAAQAALHDLCASADVLMHNIRPQKLHRIGIDGTALRRANPRLIYAALVGFGEDGPYAGRPAYDDIIQGMSGLAMLVHHQFGEVRYLPTIAADKSSAMTVAQAILAALFGRERSGQGCEIEIPMFESTVAFNLVEHMSGRHFDPPLSATGYARVLARSRRPYRASDGYLCLMPYTDTNWRDFFAEVGAPHLADDPRFVGMAQRTRNIEALLALVTGFIGQRTVQEWLTVFERLQIAAARIASLDELQEDPHLLQTGFYTRIDDAAMGALRFPGVPVKIDGERPPIRMAPRLGEHTREILAEAGLPPERIEALLKSGAAVQALRPDAAAS